MCRWRQGIESLCRHAFIKTFQFPPINGPHFKTDSWELVSKTYNSLFYLSVPALGPVVVRSIVPLVQLLIHQITSVFSAPPFFAAVSRNQQKQTEDKKKIRRNKPGVAVCDIFLDVEFSRAD